MLSQTHLEALTWPSKFLRVVQMATLVACQSHTNTGMYSGAANDGCKPGQEKHFMRIVQKRNLSDKAALRQILSSLPQRFIKLY